MRFCVCSIEACFGNDIRMLDEGPRWESDDRKPRNARFATSRSEGSDDKVFAKAIDESRSRPNRELPTDQYSIDPTHLLRRQAINFLRLNIATKAADTCKNCAARNIGFCATLSSDEIGAVSAIKAIKRTLPAGFELYRQGIYNPDYVTILDGWVALYTTLEHGACHIVDFGVPGSFLGTGADRNGIIGHTAYCITPVQICVFPRKRFDELGFAFPGLTARLLRITGCHEARGHDHMINISCRNARERIVHLLLELYYRAYRRLPDSPGEKVPFPLRLDHIGDALGLTGVHVSRTLKLLREEGVVGLNGRQLQILDPSALIRIAGFECPIADYDTETQDFDQNAHGTGFDRASAI